MKVEIEIESNGKNGDDEMKAMKQTAFQKRVAQMMAKRAGRRTPNEHEMKMAAELESELDEYGSKK
jgi:hypothetical protein